MESNTKSMNLPDSSFRERKAAGYVDLRIRFWYEDNDQKVFKKYVKTLYFVKVIDYNTYA